MKGRAFAGLGLHPDSPPVTFHHPFADRQTSARPGVLRMIVLRLEDDKNALGVLRIDPDTVIADRKKSVPAQLLGRHMNANRRFSVVLEGVFYQNSKQ
jgi:hypothetical protein